MKREHYSVLSYYGKGLKEMTYHELMQEHAVMYWWTQFLKQQIFRYERITSSYSQWVEKENAEWLEKITKMYEDGEITQYGFMLRKGRIGNKNRKLSNRFARLNYLKMIYYESMAYKKLVKERKALKAKPKKRNKPRQGIYKVNNFKPRKSTQRRNRLNIQTYQNFMRWTNEQEKKGLGELWNKEEFDKVCANRGYVTDIMIRFMISNETGCDMLQARFMHENGCFTWLQIMLIGACLQLTPTEFAECFMSGYFKEIGNGLYQATYDKIPKEAVISVPIFESADDKSEDS